MPCSLQVAILTSVPLKVEASNLQKFILIQINDGVSAKLVASLGFSPDSSEGGGGREKFPWETSLITR